MGNVFKGSLSGSIYYFGYVNYSDSSGSMRHGSDSAYIMLGNHSVGMVYDFWNEYLSTRSSNGFFDAYLNNSMLTGLGI